MMVKTVTANTEESLDRQVNEVLHNLEVSEKPYYNIIDIQHNVIAIPPGGMAGSGMQLFKHTAMITYEEIKSSIPPLTK